MSKELSKYLNTIERFSAGQLAAKEFEQQFLSLFKNDEASVDYPEAVVEILDTLFGAVDEYCDDPELRAQLPRSLDEKQLLAAASVAAEKLRTFVN